MSLIDGYWQIFLHEMITEKTIQLTRGGNNVNPKIDNGRVVWEGWINGSWQVFLSDGTAIIPITSGDMAINPMIEGNYVVYSRKDIDDQWRSEAYSVKEKKSLEISFGEENRYVELDQGKILLGTKEKARKTFPLLVEDLFLLNLPSLKEGDKTDTGVTAEEILNEINVLLKENESITVPLPATGSSY